jgi:hypothetical protein
MCDVIVDSLKCGQIGPFGSVILCADCYRAANIKYPQGWSVVPGDTCPHGMHMMPADGRDAICGHCESG